LLLASSRCHFDALTGQTEYGNTCAHLHIAPFASRHSVWTGRRCAILGWLTMGPMRHASTSPTTAIHRVRLRVVYISC
jgi:hypothetical protein